MKGIISLVVDDENIQTTKCDEDQGSDCNCDEWCEGSSCEGGQCERES
jgi:hypothetical protein